MTTIDPDYGLPVFDNPCGDANGVRPKAPRPDGYGDPTRDFRVDRIEKLRNEAEADTEAYQKRMEARIKEAASLSWDIRSTEGYQYAAVDIGLREIAEDTYKAWAAE